MKFSPVWWVVFGLAAIIILLILFDKDPKPEAEKIQALEMGIAHDKLRIKELSDKNIKDSTAHVQKVTQIRDSLKREQRHGAKLSSNLARLKANPIVIQVRDSIPVIDSLVQSYDSLLESKDDQIELQGRLIVSLEDENKRITGNFIERLQLTEDNFQAQKAISDSYKKDLRKERRKVKLFKVLTVVGTVGGIFLGSL
jgi:hypothetical protein